MLCWSVALLVLASALPSDVLGADHHKLHDVMSDRQHSLFFSGEKGPEYDLVTPTSRDASGDYLSHQLQMTGDVLKERRQRRSADNHDEDSTFLHMAAFGEDHQLTLKRNRRMFHPHFSVNIHDHDGEMRTLPYDMDCFHHGQIKGHDDSEIAMSNCQGKLMGTIRRKREIYHIHPLPSELRGHETHNPEGHTHIIHRVREKTQNETGYNANAEAMRKRQKREADAEPSPVNVTSFCHEDDKVKSSRQQLQDEVDMADTLVLNEFQHQSAASQGASGQNREFGNNYVHAAMFLDHTMYEKYNGDEGFLVLYHLTMFNMVNLIYQPSRTQYNVYIVLINLRIFQRPQANLHITQHSLRLLDSFCSFQQHMNPAIGHPLRWNHAFLVTGYGLCDRRNDDCGELGRAHIEGVCIPDRECSVNREGGLNTAFVLAHELGHNLGMFHDGHMSKAAHCPASDGFLMKSTTADAPRLWQFSSCSRSHLRSYLRNPVSACMDKGTGGPTRQTDLTNELRYSCRKPPGQLFSRDEQCRLQFRHMKNRYQPGHSFKFCTRASYGPRDICKHLYCDQGDNRLGCATTYTPAMDGTVCGTNKVCWRYQCVPAQRMYTESSYCAPEVPGPRDVVDVPTNGPIAVTNPPAHQQVDGSWSFFSAFSQCSRSCGGGIRYRTRTCSSPAPRFGGQDCQGSSRMFEVCNSQDCPNRQSYRQSQCQRFGSTWHESLIRAGEEPCSLWCEQRNLDGSTRRRHYASPAVEDGVRCTAAQGGNGRCIRDVCTRVGCDNIINSTARVDKCGVCGGTGETCKAYAGSISNNWQTFGFHSIKLRSDGYSIPRGSFDISINFTEPTSAAVMVLRNTNDTNRVYFLHGPGAAIRSGGSSFLVGNTIGQFYNYNGRKQRLVISRKTDIPLMLEVLYFPERGDSVDIDFSWKSEILPENVKFEWITTMPYGQCSVTCGRGVERKVVRCYNRFSGSLVKDATCIRNGFSKPLEERECARPECGTVAVFRQEALSECNGCGGQIQNQECVAVNPSTGAVTGVLHPRMCDRFQRMSRLETCAKITCEPRVQYCHEDMSPMCKFYVGKLCPADMMMLCPKTCNACELMT